MTSGHIKVYRKILDWEWYKSTNTKVVFIHMVLKAYWRDTRIEGVTITRGSFISSVKKLAEETSLTYSQVRRAVNNLKKTGEITTRSTNRFTIFTVENFDLYQSSGERMSGQNRDCKHDSMEPWHEERAYEMITKYGFSKPETNCQGLFNQIHKKATKKCQKQILAPDTFADGLFAPA